MTLHFLAKSVTHQRETGGHMRIVLNAGSIGNTGMSGIGHYTAALTRGLSRCRTTESFTLVGDPEALRPLMSLSNYDRAFLPIPGADLWEQLELPELLLAEGADVYHSPAFGLPLIKSCRYVATVHDCIPRLFPELASPWLCRFFQQWAPLWLERADHVICDSQHTCRDLTHFYGLPPEKMTVVYQAVNEVFQPAAPEAIIAVRKRYGLDRPYVLVVGRVELRKNVAGMLRAFQLLRETDIDRPLLVLAGPRDADVHDPEGILPPDGRHGEIVVTGYVPDAELAALYSGASAFCFPSFYEGFGRPVLEAMSCGVPVVASRTSSVPEVGGDACLYVNPYDAEDIAQALYRVLTQDDLRRALVTAGLARAADFTLERMGRDTMAVYHQVMRAEA
ncbi:MAG: glycosyltransferase family 1 protein [Armatimonadia bacterium]